MFEANVKPDGAHPPSTTLFDITTQIWPYLDAYAKLAIRLSCQEGLRVHDCLIEAISVHDLWGRALPGSPQEIAAALRRIIKRGCAPRELILRLRGCSPVVREARGLAALSAFTPTHSADALLKRREGDCAGAISSGGGNSSRVVNAARLFIGAGCSDFSESSSGRSSCSSDSGRDSAVTSKSMNSSTINSSCHGIRSSSSSSSRSATHLRLEGVPLTPRVLRALAAIGRNLTRLKLYGYDVGTNGGAVAVTLGGTHRLDPASAPLLRGSKATEPKDTRRPSQRSTAPGLSSPSSTSTSASAIASAPATIVTATALLPAAVARGRDGLAPSLTRELSEPWGVTQLLQLLARQLEELTLQDCTFGAGVYSPDSSSRRNACTQSGGGGSGAAAAGESGGRAASDALVRGDRAGCGNVCGSCMAPSATTPLPSALRACSALRHLGLRHTAAGGCPVLQLLLRPGACTCSWKGKGISGDGVVSGVPVQLGTSVGGTQTVPYKGQASSTHPRSPPILSPAGGPYEPVNDAEGPVVDVGKGRATERNGTHHALGCCPSPPQPQPVILAMMTQLTSLKLQTSLPAPCGLYTLVAALQQLTGLTRLELGQRTAVQTVRSLLLQPPIGAHSAASAPATPLPPSPPLRNLRDLSLVSATANSAAELRALSDLQQLTRVSLQAINLAASLTQPAVDLDAAPSHDAVAASPGAVIPLPVLLQELSVVAPLSPSTLLALRWPPSLQTLRLTGFALDMRDVEDSSCNDAGGGGSAADWQLQMRASSERQLCLALEMVHGRFVYRDLGIELHIGFQGPAALRRRYLAAPASTVDRTVGHWAWMSRLVPLGLQGLELAGLELQAGDLEALACHLQTLEDLRLDCRYPLPAVAHLAALRRLRRLLLNASFWELQTKDSAPALASHLSAEHQEHHHQEQQQQQQGHQQRKGGYEAGQAADTQQGPRDFGFKTDAEAAATALTSLCNAAPKCLYDITLASYGRASARFCAMQAVVWTESQLKWVGCGALRLWVSP